MRALASRRVVTVAIAVTAGTGLGWGAYTLGNAAGADMMVFTPTGTSTTTPPAEPGSRGSGSTGTPAATPLTVEEAVAVAVRSAPPGRVGEVSEDREPTGLRYDVTVLHDDGTSTDVEVDTVTGQVTSLDHDDDWD